MLLIKESFFNISAAYILKKSSSIIKKNGAILNYHPVKVLKYDSNGSA